MDVKTTFLNENLTEEIYIKRPEGLDALINKVHIKTTSLYMVLSKLQNSGMKILTGLFITVGIESVNQTSAFTSRLLKGR